MKKGLVLTALIALFAVIVPSSLLAECVSTGFVRDNLNLTAALINPAGAVTGEIDAAGCDIGVYYDQGTGLVTDAIIHGVRYFGIVVNGDVAPVAVDVADSVISYIGDNPINGSQHGVGIYYRALGSGSATGKISGNRISNYQKGGIVANGPGTTVTVKGNTVNGLGPVPFIAQNGIQIGYGALATVTKNTVTANSYTGSSTVSGGITVVGGPYYGGAYTIGTQIVSNVVQGNDIGVYISNWSAVGGAPEVATNISVVNNTISNGALSNNYYGVGYQAGISVVGNKDKIIRNRIFGDGYDPQVYPSAWCYQIDVADEYSPKAKVHANVLEP